MTEASRAKIFLVCGVGALAASVAVVFAVSQQESVPGALAPWRLPDVPSNGRNSPEASAEEDSRILPLALLSAEQRREQLETIAREKKESVDRHRARYLLAVDSLDGDRASEALVWLEGLEKAYPLLAPYVALKTATAQEKIGDPAAAKSAWQYLLQTYPQHPVAAEALYALGKADPSLWQQAIERFPAHPRALEIARSRVKLDPKQPASAAELSALLHIVRNTLDGGDYLAVLDRLTETYASQLTPEDWEAIAFGYWEYGIYGKAGQAYRKAPTTALNTYRNARGLHLGESDRAIAAYQRLLQAFPDAEETGQGLLHLASLSPDTEALQYYDLAAQRYPKHAPDALLAKADVLETLQSPKSARQARQDILSQYGDSDTAAELRWQTAQQLESQGDLQGAWSWAKELLDRNPDSDIAPRASYWIGKWAERLGRLEAAERAFGYTLARYPKSYYAWRSAVRLGWEVGDFTTLRFLNPEVVYPSQLPSLPAGSELLQELYRLGRYRDAWVLWQAEFANLREPTVAEQFTDGLIRIGIGDNLDGIFAISSLDWREKPEEVALVQQLQQQWAYWQALYPFPFLEEILQWSEKRQVNPMLVTSLIRQESRFMPKIESSAGALGLMQVMPGTGKEVAGKLGIKEYDLGKPDDNIRLGTWYLRFTHDEYNNNSLLAVASYNAGPGNIDEWIRAFRGRRFGCFCGADSFSRNAQLRQQSVWQLLELSAPVQSNGKPKAGGTHPKRQLATVALVLGAGTTFTPVGWAAPTLVLEGKISVSPNFKS